MRQSLILLVAATLLGASPNLALSDDSAGQPEKLTPVKPTPAPARDKPPVPVMAKTPISAAPAKAVASAPKPASATTAPATVSAPKANPVPPAVPGVAAAPTTVIAPSCLPEIAKAERRYGIPDGLLVAIGLTESGRRDEDTGVLAPWPWTINSHGEGSYFDTAEQAAAKTAEFLAQNDGLVDVGCMQVDLYHHPHAFQTLLAAFDPETNVDYAARFLSELKDKNGTWITAVAAYNAGDPRLGAEYVARVLYYWKELGTRESTATVVAAAASGDNPQPARRGYIIESKPSPLEIAAGFVEKKDYLAAVAIYRAVLNDDADDQTAMFGLAQVLHATGRDDDARAQLERVLTENPNNRMAMTTLLSVIDDMPSPQRMSALLSARQVMPSSAQIPARIAMLEETRGNTKEAIAQMGSAVRLSPGDPLIMLNYALLLDRGGYRTASADAYTRFLQLYQPGSYDLSVSLDQVRQRLIYLRSSAH